MTGTHGPGGLGWREGNGKNRRRRTRRVTAARRQGSLGIGRHNSGLQAVDGDVVGGETYLKLKVVGRTAKDTVRTIIERGERGDMTVTANQDKIGGEKVGRQGGGRLTSRGCIVAGRSGSESRHAVAEVIKKGRRRNVGGVGGGRGSGEELTRKNKRRAVNGLSRGGGVVVAGSGPKAEEYPGQLRRPGRSCGAGPQGILEAAVDPLHHAVGSRMIGGGGDVSDVKEGGERGPEAGGKLRSTIRGDVGRHSEAGDPGGEEGCGAGGGGGFVERDGFHPASRAVNDRENVCVSLGGGKGANQVDVDVGETAVRDGNGGGSEMDMAVNLGALAGEAFTGPSGDVLGEGLPNKTGGDEAAGGTAARMRDIVEQGEHGAAEGDGDQGTESASGDVAMKQ